MIKKSTRNVFLIFLAVVIAIAMIGYRIWNKPHSDIRKADALKITSMLLYDIFSEKDSIATAYLNKVVEVSGLVKEITKNEQDQQILLLNTNVSGGAVNCTMEEKINNIKPGDNIVVKGVCSGYIDGDIDMDLPGDVFLIRCYQSTNLK